MSKYTTELRYICETAANLTESEGFNKVNEILTKAIPKIFDFDFPIFDEEYRGVLERKILRHYYTREICEETVGLWKLRLEDKLNIIMPYYNELYKSNLLEFNPFYDVDLTIKRDSITDGNSQDDTDYSSIENAERNRQKDETNDESMTESEHSEEVKDKNKSLHESGTGNETGNRTENNSVKEIGAENSNEKNQGTANDNSWNLFSDTPQGGINGIENAYSPNLSNEAYLTDARNIKNNSASENTSEANSHNFKNADGKNESEYETNNGYSKDNSETNKEEKTNNVDKQKNYEKELHTKDTANDEITKESKNKKKRESRNIEDYLEKVSGKRGGKSYASLLTEFRNTFLNIDNMVIDELEDLFMCIW